MTPDGPIAWLPHFWARALRRGRGRPLGALCLVALVAFVLGPERGLPRVVRLGALDAYQAVLPRPRASAPAVIVAIDEASLAERGQWPWPRTVLADLVARIMEGGPAAIGIDILMPEPDRLSPDRLATLVPGITGDLAARLSRLESNDTVLAGALRTAPAVLGVAGVGRGETSAPSPIRWAPVLVRGGDPGLFVRHFDVALASLGELDRAAPGHGLINASLDTGMVRQVPLVAAVGGRLVPALGLEMLRVASGAPAVSVRVTARGIVGVGVGDLTVPTQPDGAVWLHYSPHDPDRFVSAANVLARRVDPGQFTRRLVLLGVTGLGLGDQHPTPLGVRMGGAEIHAQLLENIFDGALLARPPWAPWAEAAALVLMGLLVILAVPALSVRASLALALSAAGLMVAGGFLLYRRFGLLLDPASPVLGLGCMLATMLGVTLAEANSQRRVLRRQLAEEREAAARLAGELMAGRRIQMGLLPDPIRAFPGEGRFNLFAFLEPARQVGGDLYDFFLLDHEHLLLLIGDVSGKGLPACLFMAMVKALCQSAALRQAGDVAAMLRDVSAAMSHENPESLFVTVWAGVLNVRTGELAYCNAGHEVPCLLAPAPEEAEGVRQLALGGGPPLCVLDDFPYAAAADRMRRGESLCLVTDGVTEAMNAEGELYGRARLGALLGGLKSEASAREVGEAVRRDVERFVAGAEPSDDLAILVLRWDGPRDWPR